MHALTRTDIRQLFPDTSVTELAIPDTAHVDWAVLDYFGWIHPSGHLGYVVMDDDQTLRGMQLRRSVNHTARPRTRMCSWCHHVYRSRGTALFSATVVGSDGRRFIGNHICRNLDCSLRIRNLASDPPTYLPETLHIEHKISRLQSTVKAFMVRANVYA
ncbi:MAG: FBP domain-containing protein [Proteobacteria bacterium]|nr:FBP domain-containing protein [Pseudomonadota bacterium]